MVRLMIVDDAAFMRLTIRKMLERHNYDIVAEACNGLEAIEKYRKYQPDIVTMDITMPELTGLEALKAIKKDFPKAKIIMVSALGQEALIREAVMDGAVSFIVKPFHEEKLIEVLEGAMS